MTMPIGDSMQRLAALESLVYRLQDQQLGRQPLLAQHTTARDTFLVRTVMVPADPDVEGSEESYPERTPEGENPPTVFPFRFVDADFTPGDQVGAQSIVAANRTNDDEPPMYGLSVGGLYLPVNRVWLATWQRGLRADTDDTTYGEWWIHGGELLVQCITTAQHLKGSDQEVFVADANDAATEERFVARNKYKTLAGGKAATAAKIGQRYYLIAGDC